MSVQTEINRIQTARNTLRTKAVSLGVGLATDNLTQLATKYDGITDRGTPNAEVQEGQSYTIEPGYYHGGAVKGVAGGGNYSLQAKSVTPTKSEQAISCDSGYYGLSSVTVGAIPDAYQDVSSVTATAADVLSPAVFVKANGDITAGTMPNRGAVSKTLDTSTTSYTIPAGYHNGNGKVSITTEAKTATPTEETQTISPASGKVLSSVTIDPIPVNYGDATEANALSWQLLSGRKALVAQHEPGPTGEIVSGTSLITGSMPNNGAVSKTLDTSTTSYTIPSGYHNGSGNVSITTETKTATPTESTQTISPASGKVLSSVTVNPIPDKYGDASGATVTAGHILSGKTAIGYDSTAGEAVVVTGTMPNNTGWEFKVADNILPKKDGMHSIPAGYHSGSYITVPSLSDLTPVDTGKTAVTAAQMLTGYQGWVSGTKVSGTMANNGAVSKTLDTSTTSYTIPAGYHNGSGNVSITTEAKTTTPTEETQTISPASGKVLSSVTVNPIPSEYGDASGATVSAGDILSGKTAIGYDSTTGEAIEVAGTMVNNGALIENITVEDIRYGNYPQIPEGYHNGEGYITVPSLSDLTPVDTGKTAVTAAQMLTGYQGWVDGEKVSGTMPNKGAVSPAALSAGGSYTIPAGYHNGSGTVTAKSLSSQTGVDSGKTAVTAANMLTGYQGWVNGTKVSGTMANNGATGGTITGLGSVTGDTSYTIPAGYTSGGTVSLTSDIENALAAI